VRRRVGNPVVIGSRRELFVDDCLVESTEGVSRELNRPVALEKAIVLDRPWEGARSGYASVCSHKGVHYLYYRGCPWADVNDWANSEAGTEVSCVATSTDGIRWERPDLDLCDVGTGGASNVVLKDVVYSHNFSPFVDTNPDASEDERFKALAGSPVVMIPERYPGHDLGVSAFVSGDGITWRRKGESSVLNEAHWPEVTDRSSIPAFWSAAEGCYVAYFRVRIGPSHLGPAQRLRWIGRTTSSDFGNWSRIELIQYDMHYTDAEILENASSETRRTSEELYTLQARPYFRAPHLILAFPNRIVSGRRVLDDAERESLEVGAVRRPGAHDSVHDSLFMASRNAVAFEMPGKEAFVRPGLDRRNWDNRNQYLATGIVQTGEAELSLYCSRHWFSRSSPCTSHFVRCSIRVDGFVSVRAPHEGGELTTVPVVFEGEKLEINYATSAAGSVQVEIQDAEGHPVSGYALGECDVVVGDEISRAVAWNGRADVAALSGKPVRLRFVQRDADLYSFRFGWGAAS